MPQDVPMGQGYMGDALLAAFPGQYRGGDPAPTSPVTYLPTTPGSNSGRPTYCDPDSGRALKLITMPGVGQVVVPVEHTMVGMQGPVVPVDYSMVGVDAIGCSVDRENISGLGHAQVCAWGVGKISKAAGAAAAEALTLVKQGRIRTAGEAQAHIAARTTKVGQAVVARLQDRIPKVPTVVDQATSQAWAAIQANIAQALSGGGVGHHPGEDLSGMDAMIWKKRQAADHLSKAAAHAVQAVLQGIQKGQIRNEVQAQAAIRQVIEAAAQKLSDKAAKFSAMKEQVVAEAWKAAAPQVMALLRGAPRPGVPHNAGPVGVRGGL